MQEKPLARLKRKEIELSEQLKTIKKAIEIIENNPDWSIIWEAMNH